MSSDPPNLKVNQGFDSRTVLLDVSSIIAAKRLRKGFTETRKYQQILSSIVAIGLVEPPVVFQSPLDPEKYLLLDGHARLEVLRQIGTAQVRCLVSTDDEAYTYNKYVNRLAIIQEYKMIVRAHERGLSPEIIGKALGYTTAMVKARFSLLDGICPEVAELLADKSCPRGTFRELRKLKPFRQIEAATTMVEMGNFAIRFAEALVEHTSPDQLVQAPIAKREVGPSVEVNRRLEREVASLQSDTRLLEDDYGPDNLKLVIIKNYLTSILNNARVVRWLAQHRSDYLKEFQRLADMRTGG